jgi:DNA-binding winged helix-turn-helix (wHTH) protein
MAACPVREATTILNRDRLNNMAIRFGAFTLDGERRQLFRGGETVHLTPKAFDLLVLLATNAPRVVSKRELHEQLWPGTFVSDATLTGVVKELRRALEDRSPGAPIIRTAHRVGYAFCPTPEAGEAARTTAAHHWLVLRGRRIALHDGEYVVGRDPKSHICLDDGSVSRRHARLVIDGPAVQLEDLGSKNGTTVGGEPVRSQVVLRGDDRLAFGSVAAVYRSSDSGMSTETRSRSNLDDAGRTGRRFV